MLTTLAVGQQPDGHPVTIWTHSQTIPPSLTHGLTFPLEPWKLELWKLCSPHDPKTKSWPSKGPGSRKMRLSKASLHLKATTAIRWPALSVSNQIRDSNRLVRGHSVLHRPCTPRCGPTATAKDPRVLPCYGQSSGSSQLLSLNEQA